MKNRILVAFATLVVAFSGGLASAAAAHADAKVTPSVSAVSGPASNLVADVPITKKPPVIPPGKGKPDNSRPFRTTNHVIPGGKSGVSTLSATSPAYHYAKASETPASAQGYFQTNSWVPGATLPACTSGSDSHTLMEISMQKGGVTGPYRDFMTELGWAQEKNAFGDCKTRLFASVWTYDGTSNGVWCGSYVGGCGYQDNGSNPVNLGADLTATGLNHVGTGKKMAMYYQATTCGATGGSLWIYYNTDWVGCWPTSGGANRLPTTYTGGEYFQAFGEVYKDIAECIGMGNDLFAGAGSAYFNTLSHAMSGAANGNFPTPSATDPTAWSVLWLNNQAFRLGGKEPPPC